MLHLVAFGCLLLLVMCASEGPWYLIGVDKNVKMISKLECKSECSTTGDCQPGYSCFQATAHSQGCCLKGTLPFEMLYAALKPNETGCFIDEQCKRACESTYCDRTYKPARCLCDKGSHFLFNKCYSQGSALPIMLTPVTSAFLGNDCFIGKKCPEFAYSEPEIDVNGFSRCILKTHQRTALLYMKRNRRQLRNTFC
uniref:Domain of unknown function DB domain-containing protein n=1 Tax=Ascaris lumbricoides TaxID=6252 RepID=A0A9J2PTC6_ASCLU